MTATTERHEIVLGTDECHQLLEAEEFGRLAVRTGWSVDIYPLNYIIDGDTLYFRSGPGSKMAELALSPDVAFEIDGRTTREAWSVIAYGRAERMNSDDEIESSGADQIAAWHPSEKYNYVRIHIQQLSGRRFRLPAKVVQPSRSRREVASG